MSQIFISYTHDDKPYLDKLVTWLKEHDFTDQELWYDRHIESGSSWRDEIATALNEAFVIVVIVSANSVKSLYCTYEWAYAMGQGIPILPLVFDAVSIADVPAPLASKQFIPCVEHIPDSLKEQIIRLRTVPPQIATINKLIYDAIYDTHRRFYILGWIGDGLRSIDDESALGIKTYFIRESSKTRQVLENLMIDKASAFTSKQHRSCWKLIDFLKEFSRLDHKVDDYLQNWLFPRFETEWLPAFEYFEGHKHWGKWTRPYFEWELNEHNEREVLAEMIRAFPNSDVREVEILIHNAAADRFHKRKMEAQIKP